MFNIQTSTFKMNETSATSEERLQILQPTVQDLWSATICDPLRKADKNGNQTRHDLISAMLGSKSVEEYDAYKKTLKKLLFRNHNSTTMTRKNHDKFSA